MDEQYVITVVLDNGQQFTATFGPLPGLPQDLDDTLAAAAARAIRDFDWTAVPAQPPIQTATVTLTRQSLTSTGIPL